MDIGSTRKKKTTLFLDLNEIETMHNAKLVVNKAKKCRANPILQLGDIYSWDRFSARPWGGSVIYDRQEQIFKMWYLGEADAIPARGEKCTDKAIGYAVSRDGIYWEKPAVDIYKVDGMEHNNIVFFDTVKNWGSIRLVDHFCVIKDELEKDTGKKYKGFTRSVVDKDGSFKWDSIFKHVYSEDGIHWSTGSELKGICDPANIIIDDDDPDISKRIKMYGIAKAYGSGIVSHNSMAYGPDLEHMVMSPQNPVIEPVEGTTIHLFCGLEYEGYYLNFYNYSFWRDYYGHKGTMLRKKDSRAPGDLYPDEGWGTFIADVRLAVNRDGVGKFTRINPDQQVIKRGEKGEWDDGFLVVTSPVIKDDEIYLFYSAACEPATSHPQENDTPNIRCGLAKLEKRRITFIASTDGLSTAVVTTAPITVDDVIQTRLTVNAGELMPYRDWIEIEVVKADTNETISGFARRDCDDIYSDGFDIDVSWKGQNSLEKLRDIGSIKLKFFIYGKARLYSFSFDKV